MGLEPELLVKVEKLKVYKCERCPKVFPKLSDLVEHKTFHDNWLLSHTLSAYVSVERAKIFKCDICTLSFCTRRELMLHKLDHIQKNVRDNRKAKRFPTNNDIVKPYKCPDCDYRFVALSTLTEHSILHKPFPYNCECGIGYYKLNDLKMHMRLVHGTELKPNITVPSIAEKENIVDHKTNSNRGPSLKAVLVKKKPAKKKWKVKIKDQNGKSEEPQPKRRIIEKPNIYIRKTSDNKYECPQCKKLLSCKNHVYIHYRIHTGERPYTCEECGKSFTQFGALKVHREAHLPGNNYACRYCDKTFKKLVYRTRHEDTHSAVKKHVCPICGKGFHDPSAKTRHVRIHTGDKRYTCPYCPKAFTDKSGLIGHKMRHEKIKKVKCQHCSMKFYTKDNLVKHMVVHTKERKYGCDICKKFFSLKSNLSLHIKAHSVFRQYKCDLCPAQFVKSPYLKRHVLEVHQNVKRRSSNKKKQVFECDHCSQQFSRKLRLKRHYLSKHSGVRCKFCPEYFPSQRDLREHRLEKSESCEICDKEFFCVKLKDKHILKVHSKVKREE